MILLTIRKTSEGVFFHEPANPPDLDFFLSKFSVAMDGEMFQAKELNGARRKAYNWTEIQIVDETTSTTYAPSDKAEFLANLVAINYIGIVDAPTNVVIADLISTDGGNVIILGSDGKLYAASGMVDIPALISADSDNYLELGGDGKLYVPTPPGSSPDTYQTVLENGPEYTSTFTTPDAGYNGTVTLAPIKNVDDLNLFFDFVSVYNEDEGVGYERFVNADTGVKSETSAKNSGADGVRDVLYPEQKDVLVITDSDNTITYRTGVPNVGVQSLVIEPSPENNTPVYKGTTVVVGGVEYPFGANGKTADIPVGSSDASGDGVSISGGVVDLVEITPDSVRAIEYIDNNDHKFILSDGSLDIDGTGAISGDLNVGGIITGSLSVDNSAFKVLTATDVQAAFSQTDDALLKARNTGASHVGGSITGLGGTTVNIPDVVGGIVNVDTEEYFPINYAGVSGLTPTITNGTTYYYIDETGTLVQSGLPLIESEKRTNIEIGYSVSESGTITIVATTVNPIQQTSNSLNQLSRVLGPVRIEGIAITAPTADLHFSISSGSYYLKGVSAATAANDPDTDYVSAYSSATTQFRNYTTAGLVSTANLLDAGYYQTGGVRTAIPGATSRYSNFFIFRGRSGTIYSAYSRDYYNNITQAIASISYTEAFASLPSTFAGGNVIPVGVISLKKNATSLQAADAYITFADRFGGFTGSPTISGTTYMLPDFSNATGTLGFANGGTGLSALGSPLQNLRVNAAGTALEYASHAYPAVAQFACAGTTIAGGGSGVYYFAASNNFQAVSTSGNRWINAPINFTKIIVTGSQTCTGASSSGADVTIRLRNITAGTNAVLTSTFKLNTTFSSFFLPLTAFAGTAGDNLEAQIDGSLLAAGATGVSVFASVTFIP